ncbi:MAG: hypothetical protein Tsb006_1790 [Rickettsiaceae bacterium]
MSKLKSPNTLGQKQDSTPYKRISPLSASQPIDITPKEGRQETKDLLKTPDRETEDEQSALELAKLEALFVGSPKDGIREKSSRDSLELLEKSLSSSGGSTTHGTPPQKESGTPPDSPENKGTIYDGYPSSDSEATIPLTGETEDSEGIFDME